VIIICKVTVPLTFIYTSYGGVQEHDLNDKLKTFAMRFWFSSSDITNKRLEIERLILAIAKEENVAPKNDTIQVIFIQICFILLILTEQLSLYFIRYS